MHISELDTPALVIDLDVMERNLRRMADYTRTHGLRLRPHTKTHKIPELARQQLALGAAGLTVAKVGEAEVMLRAETPDFLVAYPVLGAQKLNRLMKVAERAAVTVALDSLVAAEQLSAAAQQAGRRISVLLEIDAGLGRMGVPVGDGLVELARRAQKLPALDLAGLAFYPGHIKSLDEAGRQKLRQLSATVEEAADLLRKTGVQPRVVSGGSTPTMFHSHEIAGMNEIRPGTYIFNDRNTVVSGACGPEDCAASIVCTVVSTAKAGQFIIDGGSKTFSSDRYAGTPDASFGLVREAPGALFHKMNEEHGFVQHADGASTVRVGDRVSVVPNHICVAMNLHETVYGVRGETVEQAWRVEGRGKLQ